MKILKKIGFIWFVALAIILINILSYAFNPFGNNTLVVFSNILPNLCALIAVISLYLTFNSLKVLDETKAAWLMLLIGILMHFLGEFIYAYYEIILNLTAPYPSLTDGFRLAGYAFLYALIIYLIIGFRKAKIPLGSLNEFGSIVLLLGVIFYFLCLELFIPIISNEEISSLEKFLDIAYPMGDLLLIFLILILMQFTGLFGKGIFYRPWRYILAGFIFMGVGDILFTYYTWNNMYKIGSYVDLFPNVGYLLIAMGALSQRKIIKSL